MSESIGVLALQGCIDPHLHMLQRIGYKGIRVTSAEDLKKIDRLILPGGESSTMLRFLTYVPSSVKNPKNAVRKPNELFLALQSFCRSNPAWGICAGAILLAKEVENPSQVSLGAIDVKTIRNFYGSQRESFKATLAIKPLNKPLSVDFIRAPKIIPLSSESREQTTSSKAPSTSTLDDQAGLEADVAMAIQKPVITLAEIDGVGVAYQQNKVIVTAFHTELGNDPALHEYFVRGL